MRRSALLLALSSSRILALPVARRAAAIAAGVLAVSLLAGVVRVLPLLLAPGVPLRVVPVLARGVLGVSLEAALFIAPPIAWAIASARLVDRGEARALYALGVHPLRLIAGSLPAVLAVAAAAGLAAISWGREAVAPGRLLQDLLAEARVACAAAAPKVAAEVPMLGVSWVCLPGEPPRLVGAAPLSGSGFADTGDGGQNVPAFAARSLAVSEDLRSLEASDLTLVFPSPEPGSASRLNAAHATITGLAPAFRASNLSAVLRAALIGGSSVVLSSFAGGLVLLLSIRERARAGALGAAGPAVALMVFSSLERGPAPAIAYTAVPIAGILGMATLGWLARRFRGRASRPGQVDS